MMSTAIYYLFIVLLNFTVDINCQTCNNVTRYGSCSTESECGCLHFPFSDHIGICAYMGPICSELSPCEGPDAFCQDPHSICVLHPQCDSRPLCFPSMWTDQQLCPEKNTTHSSILTTNYSGVLTTNNAKLTGKNSYYQAFEIIVKTSGAYEFSSSNNIDGYGCLYRDSFHSSNPLLNHSICNDDMNGRVLFITSLEADVLYTFLFTTVMKEKTGPFSITLSGPDNVKIIPINIAQITTPTTSTRPSILISNYSGIINPNNKIVPGKRAYYHAVELKINTTGTYKFSSLTSIETSCCLYSGHYYVPDPQLIRCTRGDEQYMNRSTEFNFNTILYDIVPYTLQFKVHEGNSTGTISVVVSGPEYITFIPVNNNT